MTPEDRDFILERCKVIGDLTIDFLEAVSNYASSVRAISDEEWTKTMPDDLEKLGEPINDTFKRLEEGL